MDHLYALIMAGGGGTRLWPLSRQRRPKQMLSLVENRNMFQAAVERLDPLIPLDHTFIVTGREYVEQLRASAPQLPPSNFIVEPYGQNTGPAVGLAAVHIQHRDPRSVIAVLTADQYIADQAKFRSVLAAAADLASRGYIVTLGIAPTFPSTGYGYIRRGESLGQVRDFQAYRAAGFTEKPDAETALHFVTSGLYSWNSGMFIFRIEQLMSEYARQQPVMHTILQEIGSTIGHDDYDETLGRLWAKMPRLSIDYAVMEHADNMAVIPVEMGWSDIGSWATLFDLLGGDQNGNAICGPRQDYIYLDTRNTLVVTDTAPGRMIVTIGLENIVIVDTPDVLLVCHRSRSEDVRQIVDRLKDAGDVAHL
ncbi:MAG TPA: mannose-1-phosphate guanylyltransferase [Aggregatilineales bacterium]|jgi:mannose-1-phosphate guanylyltransferase|nr:mannose-1-phosphate guanylyltransferase [Aggregatilineales bacterium]